jgi:putative transposase
MGEDGFAHGMKPEQLKRIRELEKENKALKKIVIQKKSLFDNQFCQGFKL